MTCLGSDRGRAVRTALLVAVMLAIHGDPLLSQG
jgi:hypothetical protein